MASQGRRVAGRVKQLSSGSSTGLDLVPAPTPPNSAAAAAARSPVRLASVKPRLLLLFFSLQSSYSFSSLSPTCCRQSVLPQAFPASLFPACPASSFHLADGEIAFQNREPTLF